MSGLALRWIFVLEEDYPWQSGRTFAVDCAFEDATGKRRLELRKGGEIRVLKGYAWDGCTPKFAFWDICIGTPDGVPNSITKKPKAYFAAARRPVSVQRCGPAGAARPRRGGQDFPRAPRARPIRAGQALLSGGPDLRRGVLQSLYASQAGLQGPQGPALGDKKASATRECCDGRRA